jgi:hypothetical protein
LALRKNTGSHRKIAAMSASASRANRWRFASRPLTAVFPKRCAACDESGSALRQHAAAARAGLAAATTSSRDRPQRGERLAFVTHYRLPDAKSPRTRATPATCRSSHRHLRLFISLAVEARLVFRPRERVRVLRRHLQEAV